MASGSEKPEPVNESEDDDPLPPQAYKEKANITAMLEKMTRFIQSTLGNMCDFVALK